MNKTTWNNCKFVALKRLYMKRVFLFAVVLLFISPLVIGKKKMPPAPKVKETEEIHWITNIDELQAKMQQNPKKVMIDIYTGWCGWCKKMDADTYTNPSLVKYINNNFYALRLDAERKDVIHFQGKEYSYDPQYKANTFAVEMLKGSMSYPTIVFMLENFQNPVPIPGYHNVKEMQSFLTFFGDNAYRHVKWDDYSKTFHSTWDNGVAPDMTPPAAH